MTKRKFASICMTVLLLLTMIPAFAVHVYAEDSTEGKQEQILEVGQRSLVVNVGTTAEELNVDIDEGDGKLVFSSEDESIATVNSYGEVTGKKVGTTNIWVYATETSAYKESEKKKIEVTVKEAVKVDPVKVSGKTVKIKYKKLKKKAQKVSASKLFKFNKKGAMVISCHKLKGSKKIKIDPNTGNVTVKKGLKKGTYKVQVTVEVIPSVDDDCRVTTQKVTFKIQVK